MRYSKSFDDYYKVVDEMIYIDNSTLDELRLIIEGVMSLLDLIAAKGKEFDKSVEFQREQFRIDLT